MFRSDIRDKAALEANFRAHFQRLNKVNLNDAEFARLRDEIITADVFTAAKIFRIYRNAHFHVDYYKPDGTNAAKTTAVMSQRAVVEAILDKHDAATNSRRFNAILATASIKTPLTITRYSRRRRPSARKRMKTIRRYRRPVYFLHRRKAIKSCGRFRGRSLTI